MSIADDASGRGREVEMKMEGEGWTQLVDGYSEWERGGIGRQMVYQELGQESGWSR